ncbi:MAG: acyl-CoA dehydrogenase family protein [Acidobacteriota bacterium]
MSLATVSAIISTLLATSVPGAERMTPTMDFSWTTEQEQGYTASVEFAQRALDADLARRDAEGTFLLELWRKCGAFGVLGWCMPEAYGGSGLDVVSTIRRLEGIGYGCRDNALTLGLNGQLWSVQEPLLQFGSEEQKQRYLPRLCSGELLAAHGMTEPGSGSDAFSLETRAEKVEGGYRLNGHKTYIGLAPVADLALVFASTDPSVGQWGISAFLVERGFPGYTASSAKAKMGLRTNPLGDIVLEDCFVPEVNRLGPEGIGVSVFTHSMDWERSFVFASHVGAMARQLDDCIAYARQRRQFDQPIGKYQSVSNRIAEMKLRLETSRLLLYKLAWMKERGEPAALEAAMAKLQISEAFAANSLDAMRIHGAKGYLAEFEVERDVRDALGGVIYSGTSDIQRNIIARVLGL